MSELKTVFDISNNYNSDNEFLQPYILIKRRCYVFEVIAELNNPYKPIEYLFVMDIE